MARRTSNKSSGTKNELLSGVMSMFGFHQVNVCDSDDQSFYCKFMRFFQLFIAIIMFCVIIYVIYSIGKSFMKGGLKGGIRR
tara:strand:+ start:227 stop:472 length:246 start_codon:yes stop_codon:yes gene_type:complete